MNAKQKQTLLQALAAFFVGIGLGLLLFPPHHLVSGIAAFVLAAGLLYWGRQRR